MTVCNLLYAKSIRLKTGTILRTTRYSSQIPDERISNPNSNFGTYEMSVSVFVSPDLNHMAKIVIGENITATHKSITLSIKMRLSGK